MRPAPRWGTADHLTAEKFAAHIEQAGFRTQTVKNQGRGAAMKRVEAARRLFPSIWFNEKTTEPGRDALGWYHEKKDDSATSGSGLSMTGHRTAPTPSG
jgi:phage terminase large subunit